MDLLGDVEHQGEQRHAHQYAVVGLAKDRQVRIGVQVVVELAGLGAGIPRQGCMMTVFGSQCSV